MTGNTIYRTPNVCWLQPTRTLWGIRVGFVFMGRKLHFKIRLRADQKHHEAPTVPGPQWKDFLQRGLIVKIGKCLAAPRLGVIAYLAEGQIQLIDTATGHSYWIKTSWYGIFRQALYSQRGPDLSPEAHTREVQAQYCDRYQRCAA